jgi:hypothetical protein
VRAGGEGDGIRQRQLERVLPAAVRVDEAGVPLVGDRLQREAWAVEPLRRRLVHSLY